MTLNERILEAYFVVDGRESLARHETKEWRQREPEGIKGVVYHQSLDDRGSASGNAKYHVGPNHISSSGLPGLSYTMFADRISGKVVLANSVEDITYSQGNSNIPGDENELYLSVCFGGNFAGPGYDPPGGMMLTGEQRSLAFDCWAHLRNVFGFKDNQLFGHYHFGKAACPGYELMETIEDIRNSHYNSESSTINFGSADGRQQALIELGYYHGKPDGEWSHQCKYALTLFQKSAGLEADGVWGPKTEAAIEVALG
jgi:hypothetical protein